MKRLAYYFLTIISIVLIAAPVTYADEGDYLPIISEIEIQSNVHVSNTVILNKVKVKEGQTLSRESINQDIKRLYTTGFFQDVKVDLVPEGRNYRVVFIVDEKPVIASIELLGNHAFQTKSLKKEIGLEEGAILDRKLLKEGIRNIEQKYRKKGFRFIYVEEEVTIDEAAKSAIILININEGQKFKIEEIQFSGNTYFDDKKLARVMRTKKDGIFSSGVFDELKFEEDIERLKLFYQQEGFLDVAVEPYLDYQNDVNKIFIEIRIEEGNQYQVGEVTFEGIQEFPKVEILEKLEMNSDTFYSPVRLGQDLNAIKKYYFEKGHINATVEPKLRFNADSGLVDVHYIVNEDKPYFVDKIRIRGNTRTKDIVIRRELRIYPGEKFDGAKIDKSINRLRDLGFFGSIDYETEPGSEPNKRDLIFKVEEKPTGELSFGGGVSSLESFIGFIELSQKNFDLWNWPNFIGDGQRMSINARWGARTRDIDVSFLEPYLLNKPISLGLRGYNYAENFTNLDFDTNRMGANITFGKNFTDELSSSIGYTLEKVDLEEISNDAFIDILNTEDKAFLSKLKWGLTYDKRNSRLFPTEGYLASFSAELVGGPMGGEEDFYILVTQFNKYWTVFEKHLIEWKSRLGVMQEYGDSSDIPVYDRFYAGGLGSIRGFGYRKVGPRGNGNPIGGRTLALTSFEYTFPLAQNFKGAFFMDIGQVDKDVYDLGFDDFTVSIGPGLIIRTPVGPIVLYYGFPIANKGDNKASDRFEFSFKRGF